MTIRYPLRADPRVPYRIFDADGEAIAMCFGGKPVAGTADRARERGIILVERCNAHDALVAELHQIAGLRPSHLRDGGPPTDELMRNIALKALALPEPADEEG